MTNDQILRLYAKEKLVKLLHHQVLQFDLVTWNIMIDASLKQLFTEVTPERMTKLNQRYADR